MRRWIGWRRPLPPPPSRKGRGRSRFWRLRLRGQRGWWSARCSALVQRQRWRSCAAPLRRSTGCGLRDTASNLVFAEGDPAARLLLIGEPPAADDDRSGSAFAGAAGAYLDRMLAAIELERGRLMLTPLIPWRPPGDRPPSAAELAVCLPFLHRLIALIAPRRLLLMGLLTARSLLPQSTSRRRPRGAWMDVAVPGTSLVLPALPTFSAAELMRDPSNRRAAWDDLRLLRATLDEDAASAGE